MLLVHYRRGRGGEESHRHIHRKRRGNEPVPPDAGEDSNSTSGWSANTLQNTGTIAVATVYFGILRVQYTAATAQLRLYTPGGTMSEWSGSLGSMTAGNTSNTASRNAAIGAEDNGSGSFVDGKIWDVRLYDRYLSDVECDAIFATRGADDILEGLQHRFMLNQFAPGAVIGTTVGLLGDCAVRNLKQQSAIGSPTGAEQGALLRRSA